MLVGIAANALAPQQLGDVTSSAVLWLIGIVTA